MGKLTHSAAIVGPINGRWFYNSFGPAPGSRAGQASFSSEAEAMQFAKDHGYTDYAKWLTDEGSSIRALNVANKWISGFYKTWEFRGHHTQFGRDKYGVPGIDLIIVLSGRVKQ